MKTFNIILDIPWIPLSRNSKKEVKNGNHSIESFYLIVLTIKIDFPWIPLPRNTTTNENCENTSLIKNNIEESREIKRKEIENIQGTSNVYTVKRKKITEFSSIKNDDKHNIVYSSYNSDEEVQAFGYPEMDDIKDDFIMTLDESKRSREYKVTPSKEKESLFLKKFFSTNDPLKSTLKAYKEAKYISENNLEDIESSPPHEDFISSSVNSIESVDSDNTPLCKNDETGYSFIRDKFISPTKKEGDFIPFKIKILSSPSGTPKYSPKHSYIEGGLANRAFKISNAFKMLKNDKFQIEPLDDNLNFFIISQLKRSYYNHSSDEQSQSTLNSSLYSQKVNRSNLNAYYFCSSYININAKVIFHESIPINTNIELRSNQKFNDIKTLIKDKMNSLYISNNNRFKYKCMKNDYYILVSDGQSFFQINVPHYLINKWMPVFSKNCSCEFSGLIVKKLKFSRNRHIYNTFVQNGSTRDSANVIYVKKDRHNINNNEPSFPASQLSESEVVNENGIFNYEVDQITKYLTKFFVLEVSLNSSFKIIDGDSS